MNGNNHFENNDGDLLMEKDNLNNDKACNQNDVGAELNIHTFVEQTDVNNSVLKRATVEFLLIRKLLSKLELLAPYTHIMQLVSSKRFRIKMPTAFNYWLRIPENKFRNALELVDMVHNGSLLLDDIQDDTRTRRGLPAAHCVYGIPLTSNTVCHVNFLAILKSYEIHPQAPKVLIEQGLKVCRGQGIEVYWRDNLICPTEQDFIKMVELKTGGMFMLAYRLLHLLSDNKTDYSKLMLMLAVYFQIRDDYCNIAQQEALEDWPENRDKMTLTDNEFYEDLTEGKFTLPIIHALQTSQREPVLNILRQRTRDVKLKKYFISLLESAGSLQYTRDFLAQLDRDARAEVSRLGGNPVLETVLDEFLTWKTV